MVDVLNFPAQGLRDDRYWECLQSQLVSCLGLSPLMAEWIVADMRPRVSEAMDGSYPLSFPGGTSPQQIEAVFGCIGELQGKACLQILKLEIELYRAMFC